ncbi:MAG: 3-methyl-2-oxobutanoate hydroxymethyltransferase [Deltaproteobacteria bacterium]|nr:MAG: 3-methyl-2-oxobutanoate hydroxymethyltransferase [Deltaproteobacteria bacterium]
MSHKTVLDLRRMKAGNPPEKIAMVTAYDATMARIVDAAGVDMVLVGDSLGMVIQGHEDTLQVTLDDMIYHGRCVRRGLRRAHLTVDLPFMSYQVSAEQALRSAGRLVQEGGAQSVKLEGGVRSAPAIEAIVRAGIPVVGHIGLTPQSVHATGGWRVQGRGADAAAALREDALAVQEAGAFCVVLEMVPTELATELTALLDIPTIGIGAGPNCDGQVLVCNDLLGFDESFKPRFVKRYATLQDTMIDAVRTYVEEVRAGVFPAEEHCFHDKRAPSRVQRIY